MSTGTNQERLEQNNILLTENNENLAILKTIVRSLPVNMETSETTATADDIAIGKTAFSNGELITGTLYAYDGITGWSLSDQIDASADQLTITNNIFEDMIIRNGATITTGASFETVAAAIGLTADKIKAGETILGITGTYEGEASVEQVTEQAEVLETQTTSLEELEEIIDSKL